MARYRYTIGIDEAGRGPLAGPVTAAAVLVPNSFSLQSDNPSTGIRDSKKYNERQREEWLSYIDSDTQLVYEFSSVWQRRIDRINIAQATNLAATRAVKRLIERNDIDPDAVHIMLDGSLKLKTNKFEYDVIIKGDEKETPIMLASIVAKVKRDAAMKRIHRRHKEYNFINHKGYGTAEHRSLIEKHGQCKYHRKTFLSN